MQPQLFRWRIITGRYWPGVHRPKIKGMSAYLCGMPKF